MSSTTSPTPSPCFTLQNTVGPSPRISLASRAMTSSEALTYCARSVYARGHTVGLDPVKLVPWAHVHTLLITNRSDCEIPGPPLRGILSPP